MKYTIANHKKIDKFQNGEEDDTETIEEYRDSRRSSTINNNNDDCINESDEVTKESDCVIPMQNSWNGQISPFIKNKS